MSCKEGHSAHVFLVIFGNFGIQILYNDNRSIYRLQAVCAGAVSNCPFCKASHPLEKCFSVLKKCSNTLLLPPAALFPLSWAQNRRKCNWKSFTMLNYKMKSCSPTHMQAHVNTHPLTTRHTYFLSLPPSLLAPNSIYLHSVSLYPHPWEGEINHTYRFSWALCSSKTRECNQGAMIRKNVFFWMTKACFRHNSRLRGISDEQEKYIFCPKGVYILGWRVLITPKQINNIIHE